MEITVNLGHRSYPIIIDQTSELNFPALYRKHFGNRRCFLITNTTIGKLFDAKINVWQKGLGFESIQVPDGEQYKTLTTWECMINALLGSNLDRTSVVIALGGGVIGDMAGFAAASFLRGVDFVQIPTTLLSIIDSSVGGKTGVNHTTGKNLIGAFHQPKLVWVVPEFLKTLSDREYIAGCGELFKNAFIGGRDMFDFVNNNVSAICSRNTAVMTEAIDRSIRIKARVVENDERESGERALLNFGHTFAHSLEHTFNYTDLLHGEAVLWGIRCACELGLLCKTVSPEHAAIYTSLYGKFPKVKLPHIPDIMDLYTGMLSDKKAKEGKLRFVVPGEPGRSIVKDGIEKEMVMQTLKAVFEG